jgi:hypothetical protein
MRVQIPEVLDAGYFFPQPAEDVRLEFMVVGTATMGVFGVPAGRGEVRNLKTFVANRAEEGYGKFQSLELAGKAHDLGIDAVLQHQSLFHWSNFSRN